MHARLTINHLFLGFLLMTSILPLVVVGGTSYQVARRVVDTEVTTSAASIIADQKEYLQLQLRQVDSLIANISSVEAIATALDTANNANDTFTNLATQARIGYILDGYSQLTGLVSIDIFTMQGVHYHVGDTLDIAQVRTDVKSRIFDQALQAMPQVVWTGIEDNINIQSAYKQVITAAKVLTKTDGEVAQRRSVGLLVVNYSVDEFYNHFKRIKIDENAYVLIVDEHQRIIYHPDRSVIGDVVNLQFIHKLVGSGGTFNDVIDGQQMLVTFRRSERTNWVVIGIIPRATLDAQTRLIGLTTLVVLLGAFGIVFLSAWYVSKAVVGPIRSITKHFKLFQAGTLNPQIRLTGRRPDEIGELIVWFNSFMESLSEKQRAESALRESEERFRTAFEYGPIGIAMVGLDGRWLHVNRAICAITGYSAKELLETNFQTLTHPDDRPISNAYLHELLTGEISSCQQEKRYFHKQGHIVWANVAVSMVRDANGRPSYFISQIQDMTQRKILGDQLEHQAFHDALTNLPNRTLFVERLTDALALAQDYRRPATVAVLFLDLDRFKVINDSLGHAAGDQLLKTVAERLQECVRPGDTCARLGGDEFSILLADISDAEVATAVADRIAEELHKPFMLGEHEVYTSTSIGIALSGPSSERAGDLLRDADLAMYIAKRDGKARYVIFDPELNTNALERLKLETDLRHAIDRDELRVFYQPIVSLDTGRICQVEALVRWQHPQLGLVAPAEFISIAEETGLIVPMGEWVLEHACRQVLAWQQEQLSNAPIMLNANLSARQFQHTELTKSIGHILQKTGFDPSYLRLEITESVAMRDAPITITTLHELKALGAQLAIDDFGTGYSSLAYLKRFPIDTLKIDRSFVDRLGQNAEDTAIVHMIMMLAKTLKLKVTGEGIETAEQLAELQALGCDHGQGYFFAKPLPSDATGVLLLQAEPLYIQDAATTVQ
ncbi:MAG: hypothetical protein NVS2B7_18140 [Herpetosiphon sp.]